MCKIKLHKSFDQHCFQMYDKHSKTIIEISEQNKVYIIKYIAKSLNEFVLISAIYISHSETVFSAAALDASLYV